MKLSTATTILVALIFAGCKDKATNPINNNSDVSVVTANTNKQMYAANEKLFITLKNETADTAYFFHCNYRIGFIIELRNNNAWTDTGSVAIFCLAIYPSGTYGLAPSHSYIDSIALNQTGKYRLMFEYTHQNRSSVIDSLFTNEFDVQ